MRSLVRVIWPLVIVALATFCLAPMALAQGQASASLAGYVTDPSGAAIPGATVTIRNVATGASRTVTADMLGHYFVSPLDAGTYAVTAKAKGFKTETQENVVLEVSTPASQNIKLPVGATSQTVVVTAAPPAHVQTETGAISYDLNSTAIKGIQTDGNNVQELALLLPGVTTASGSGAGVTDVNNKGVNGNVAFEFNGVRPDANYWILDGAEMRDNGSAVALNIYPSTDAIQEYKVFDSNYSAAYGGASVVSELIKSGTNQFHGTAYEFIRNDALNANDPFTKFHQGQLNPATNKVNAYKWNDFGYTIGGPIQKDKTFFFWSEEWNKLHQAQQLNFLVPTTAELAGNFTGAAHGIGSNPTDPTNNLPGQCGTGAFAGFVNPSTGAAVTGVPVVSGNQLNCVDPAGLALAQSGLWPAPNIAGVGDSSTNFTEAVPTPTNFREEILRVDHTFTPNVQIFAHYIHDSYDFVNPGPLWWGNSPTYSDNITTPGNSLAVELTQVLSPSLVNDVGFDMSGNTLNIQETGPSRPKGIPATLFGGDPANRPPLVGLWGASGYYSPDPGPFPWKNNFEEYSVHDNVTQTSGQMTWTYGAEYFRGIKNQANFVYPPTSGEYGFGNWYGSGNDLANMLLGLAAQYGETNTALNPYYRYDQFEAFVQNDWHVSRNLTMNLGVRYYLIPMTYSATNQLATFSPAVYNALPVKPTTDGNTITNPGACGCTYPGNAPVGTNGVPAGFAKTQYWNFAPRVGFSWDPTGDGTWAVRGGIGSGYYRDQGNEIYGTSGNPPLTNSISINNGGFNPNNQPMLSNPTGGMVAGNPSVRGYGIVDANYKTPMFANYSLSVERALGNSTVLSAAYVGDIGARLPITYDLNTPTPEGGFDFNPALNNPNNNKNLYRPYLGVANVTDVASVGKSRYDSFQFDMRRNLSHGLQYDLNYTWSHELDDSSWFAGGPQNPYNLLGDWASGDFNVANAFNASWIYSLPVFHGNGILGGWQVGGQFSASSGIPINLGGGNFNGGNHTSQAGLPTAYGNVLGLASRPNITGPITYGTAAGGLWAATVPIAIPAAGMYGNMGRNMIVGPSWYNVNLTFDKSFAITERVHAKIRAAAYNLFNHPIWSSYGVDNTPLPGTGVGTVPAQYASSATQAVVIPTGAHQMRQVELGLHITF